MPKIAVQTAPADDAENIELPPAWNRYQSIHHSMPTVSVDPLTVDDQNVVVASSH